MNRILLSLLISVAVWEGFVYLYSRPRFWVGVVQVCTWVGTGALRIHGKAKDTQARAHARAGDTVTDIEDYLRRQRSDG